MPALFAGDHPRRVGWAATGTTTLWHAMCLPSSDFPSGWKTPAQGSFRGCGPARQASRASPPPSSGPVLPRHLTMREVVLRSGRRASRFIGGRSARNAAVPHRFPSARLSKTTRFAKRELAVGCPFSCREPPRRVAVARPILGRCCEIDLHRMVGATQVATTAVGPTRST